MTRRAVFKIVCLFFVNITFLFYLNGSGYAKDLKASVAYLPLLSESLENSPFVELVKAIDDVYSEGNITIKIYPFARSIQNVINGQADFHLPIMRSSFTHMADKPFRFATKPMGTVCHVIYSHVDNPISIESINQALSENQFPYNIEVILGVGQFFDFPSKEVVNPALAFKRISAKRSDALISAQEEGDYILKQIKDKNIYRSLVKCWDDLIIIPKGEKGDEIDQIISAALNKLEQNGRLQIIRNKIHLDYNGWQPENMDW